MTFTQSWDSTYGVLKLTQNGNEVSGSYPKGIVRGRLDSTSQRLVGTWEHTQDDAKGWFSFKMSTDKKSFSGEWGWGTGNRKRPKKDDWNGTIYRAVLVNIGDSYAAGVGTGRYDLNKGAKRSSLSGQHRAMVEFASGVPSIIINVSVSGNKLNPHIITGSGKEGVQLRQVKAQLRDYVKRGILMTERVDYLIVSAGGNDMSEDGLTGLILALLVPVRNPFSSPLFIGVRNNIAENLTGFKRDLDRLHRFLRRDPVFKKTKVIYCTYPDSTRDENGKHTKAPSNLLPKRWNRKLTSLNSKDFEFAYEYMIKNINQRIRHFCQLNPNYILNDVEPVSRRHGYPASHSYFVRLRLVEAPLTFDAFHPTTEGYARIYLDTIKPLLRKLESKRTV